MGRVRGVVWAMVAAAVLLSGPAGSWAQRRDEDQPQAGAYKKLDILALHRLLQTLGMREVEAYHMKAIEALGGEDVLRIRIEGLRAHGLSLTDSSAEARRKRRDIFNQAIALQLELIRQVAKRAQQPPDKLTLLEDTFELAVIAGIERAEQPYALPLMFLRGTGQDRRDTAALTKNAALKVLEVQNQIQRYLDQWNSLEDQVTTRPRLDRLRQRMVAQGMWIYLYRGMSVENTQEARQWLTQATSLASKAIEEQIGVYRGHLVYGVASRLLGKYPEALEHLNKADDENAPVFTRIQALFEMPRVLADQGNEAAALAAAGQYYTKTVALIDALKAKATTDEARKQLEDSKLAQEIGTAILRSEIYDTVSRLAKDPAVKAEKKRQAMFALVDFVNAKAGDPAVQSAMFKIIVYKYAEGIDLDKPETLKNANSVVLMALAVVDQGLWADDSIPEGQRIELLDKAEAALSEIVKRDDPISKRMRPDALWYMALAANQKRQTQRAGQLFTQIAHEYPASAMAPKAAYFAVRTYAALIFERSTPDPKTGKTQIIPGAMREEYVDALEYLLGNDKWVQQMPSLLPGDPAAVAEKIRERYWDLGWQLEQLAATTRDPKKKLARQKQAVSAYRRVPESSTARYLSGLHSALNMEVEIVRAMMDAGDTAYSRQASKLLTRLQQYVSRADAEARKVKSSDERFSKDLSEWAAEAAFNEAVVRYRFLNDAGNALSILERLPKERPGTMVVEACKEFEIRVLIERGMTTQAMEKLKEYNDEYAGNSRALIDLLMDNLRKEIQRIERSSVENKASRLRTMEGSYAELARMLYDQTVADPKSEADDARKLAIRKIYGEALIRTGKFQEALDQFTQCQKIEDVQRDARKAEIDTKWNGRIRMAEEAAKAGAQKLADLVDRVIKGMPPGEFDASSKARGARRMHEHIEKMIAKGDPKEMAEAVQRMVKSYTDWMKDFADREKRNVPEDLNTLRGLARSHIGLKQYKEGVEIFRRIAWVMDPGNPEYWQAQLEFYRASFKANEATPAVLENLLGSIGDLRERDPEFGGLYPEFNLLEAEVRRKLGK